MADSTLEQLYGALLPLVEAFTNPLHVQSVEHRFIEGPALKYSVFLPLRTMSGEEVFLNQQVKWITELFNKYFAGSSQFVSKPVPPIIGAWSGTRGMEYERVNIFTVYSRVAEEETDQLFRQLGVILRGLTEPEQDDILIEKVAVELISCRRDDEPLGRGS